MSTPAPRARPRAALTGALVAVALAALAAVGIHDLLVAQGWSRGSSWIDTAVHRVDGLGPSGVTSAVGVAAVLLGLALVWAAIAPARRTHDLAPADDVDVWVSRAALRKLAVDAAEETPGVESAEASVSRRAVRVRYRTPDPSSAETVRANVENTLDGLTTRTIKVRAQEVTYD